MITENEKIYDRIVEVAKEKKISINQLEKDADVSIGSVCKWNSVSPTVRNLKKVARCLGVSIDVLLE